MLETGLPENLKQEFHQLSEWAHTLPEKFGTRVRVRLVDAASTYTGLKTTRYLLDYGPHYYDTGIPTVNPPLITPPYEDNSLNGPIYPSYVPKTDHDGNDIAGVRLPDVTVRIATYTGWALRAGPQAESR